VDNILRPRFRHPFKPAQVYNTLLRLKQMEAIVQQHKETIAQKLQMSNGSRPSDGWLHNWHMQFRRNNFQLIQGGRNGTQN